MLPISMMTQVGSTYQAYLLLTMIFSIQATFFMDALDRSLKWHDGHISPLFRLFVFLSLSFALFTCLCDK